MKVAGHPAAPRRHTFLLQTACCLACAFQVLAGADDVDARLQHAERLLGGGRPAEAEAIYRALIAELPELADSYDGLARALVAQARPVEAVGALLRAASGLMQSHRLPPAIDYLERAVGIDPGSAAAHAGLGQALLRADRFERAAEHLRRAVDLGDSRTPVLLHLGAALWESGQIDAAERVYRRALERQDAGRVPALQSLGGLLLWRGRYQQAAKLLDEAAGLDPDSVTLQLDLARALEGTGDHGAALGAYHHVVRLAPDAAAARYGLARLLARTGDSEAARRELEVFRQLHEAEQRRLREEGMQRARLEQGWELLGRGRYPEAAQHFRRLPRTPDSLAGLASALSAAGDHRGAADALEQALLLDPQRQDLRRMLAEERLADGAAR